MAPTTSTISIRGDCKQARNDQFKIEQVLGVTHISKSALACHPKNGCVAFPAACILVLLDTKTHKQSYIKNPSGRRISCVTFSRDGNLIAFGETGVKPFVSVWHFKKFKELNRFMVGESCTIRDMLIHPKYSYMIVLTAQNFNIDVYDYERGVRIAVAKWPTVPLAMSLLYDGMYLAVCGHRKITIFSMGCMDTLGEKSAMIERRAVLLGHQSEFTFVDITSGDGKHERNIYTVTERGFLVQILLYDNSLEKRQKVADRANCVRYNLEQVFVGCSKAVVKICNPDNLSIIAALSLSQLPDSPLRWLEEAGQLDTEALVVDEENSVVTCVCSDYNMYSWKLSAHEDNTLQCALVPEDRSLVIPDFTGGPTNNRQSHDIGCLKVRAALMRSFIGTTADANKKCRAFRDPISLARRSHKHGYQGLTRTNKGSKSVVKLATTMRLTPDGQDIIHGNSDGVIKVYDAKSGKLKRVIEAHSSEVTYVELMYDNTFRLVCTGGRDRIIFVIDAGGEFTLMQLLYDHTAAISAISLARNEVGLILVSMAADGLILIRRSPPIRPIKFEVISQVMMSSCHPVINASLAAKYLVTADRKQAINMYRIHPTLNMKPHMTVKCLQKGQKGILTTIDIDPTGTFLAAGRSAGETTVYHLRSGKVVGSLESPHGVSSLKFSNDLEHMVSTAENGCVFIWKLPPHMIRVMKSQGSYEIDMTKEISYETYVSCIRICKSISPTTKDLDVVKERQGADDEKAEQEDQCDEMNQGPRVQSSMDNKKNRALTPTIETLSLLSSVESMCLRQQEESCCSSSRSYISCSSYHPSSVSYSTSETGLRENSHPVSIPAREYFCTSVCSSSDSSDFTDDEPEIDRFVNAFDQPALISPFKRVEKKKDSNTTLKSERIGDSPTRSSKEEDKMHRNETCLRSASGSNASSKAGSVHGSKHSSVKVVTTGSTTSSDYMTPEMYPSPKNESPFIYDISSPPKTINVPTDQSTPTPKNEHVEPLVGVSTRHSSAQSGQSSSLTGLAHSDEESSGLSEIYFDNLYSHVTDLLKQEVPIPEGLKGDKTNETFQASTENKDATRQVNNPVYNIGDVLHTKETTCDKISIKVHSLSHHLKNEQNDSCYFSTESKDISNQTSMCSEDYLISDGVRDDLKRTRLLKTDVCTPKVPSSKEFFVNSSLSNEMPNTIEQLQSRSFSISNKYENNITIDSVGAVTQSIYSTEIVGLHTKDTLNNRNKIQSSGSPNTAKKLLSKQDAYTVVTSPPRVQSSVDSRSLGDTSLDHPEGSTKDNKRSRRNICMQLSNSQETISPRLHLLTELTSSSSKDAISDATNFVEDEGVYGMTALPSDTCDVATHELLNTTYHTSLPQNYSNGNEAAEFLRDHVKSQKEFQLCSSASISETKRFIEGKYSFQEMSSCPKRTKSEVSGILNSQKTDFTTKPDGKTSLRKENGAQKDGNPKELINSKEIVNNEPIPEFKKQSNQRKHASCANTELKTNLAQPNEHSISRTSSCDHIRNSNISTTSSLLCKNSLGSSKGNAGKAPLLGIAQSFDYGKEPVSKQHRTRNKGLQYVLGGNTNAKLEVDSRHSLHKEVERRKTLSKSPRKRHVGPITHLLRNQDDYLKKLKEVRERFEESIEALSRERMARGKH